MKRRLAGSVHWMEMTRWMGREVKAREPFFQVMVISQSSATEVVPGSTLTVLAAAS